MAKKDFNNSYYEHIRDSISFMARADMPLEDMENILNIYLKKLNTNLIDSKILVRLLDVKEDTFKYLPLVYKIIEQFDDNFTNNPDNLNLLGIYVASRVGYEPKMDSLLEFIIPKLGDSINNRDDYNRSIASELFNSEDAKSKFIPLLLEFNCDFITEVNHKNALDNYFELWENDIQHKLNSDDLMTLEIMMTHPKLKEGFFKELEGHPAIEKAGIIQKVQLHLQLSEQNVTKETQKKLKI